MLATMTGPDGIDSGGDSGDDGVQRLDKWLWCARFFKTRALANKLLAASRLRLDGRIVAKAHQRVRVGEVLTFPQGPHVRVIRVLSLAARRGPAREACLLYEDLAPPPDRRGGSSDPAAVVPAAPGRSRGDGRPTKRARRALERLQGARETGGEGGS